MIDKVKYDAYIESLLNIARLTNKENSILAGAFFLPKQQKKIN